MEIDTIYYKAKDGRLFTDPLKCEAYEKTLGVIPNSVGNLINLLKDHKPEEYINGIVMVKHPDGKCGIYMRATCCVDDKLESFVNVKDLTPEQRYSCTTVGDLIYELEQTDKDWPCQYMIVYSANIDMNPPGCMANYNAKVWYREKK